MKPGYIPQDVWETVIKLQMGLGCCPRDHVEGLIGSNSMIADVIMAERERNRLIARKRVEDLYAVLQQPLSDGEKGHFASMLIEALLIEDRIDDERSYSASIRNGGIV